MDSCRSWGGLKGHEQQSVSIHWQNEISKALGTAAAPLLCYGLGRSYGDSCLPSAGTALHMRNLNKLRSFDPLTGVLSAEAGMSIAELLEFSVPRGWFMPVSPGTKYVSLGGAIANDIHGKNHHKRGTLGRHILEFELIRSTGERLLCSRNHESEIFAATIGGLGLTGVISWCSIQLIPIQSATIDAEFIKTKGLDDFFTLEDESAESWEYTVSWIDCMAKGKDRGRGIFIRGRHSPEGSLPTEYPAEAGFKLNIPIDAPSWLLNPLSIRAFNQAYYHKQQSRSTRARTTFDPFFYPLDKVLHWNRLYGKPGLFQYQFVIDSQHKTELAQIFQLIAESGQGSFLAVLKKFGNLPSPGLLSFPREGYTLTLDFQNQGQKSLQLFHKLDAVVASVGGRLYPAKDATMSGQLFRQAYPMWQEFSRYIDPKFTSLFWQRVSRADT